MHQPRKNCPVLIMSLNSVQLNILVCRAINGAGCQMVTPCVEDENMSEFVWLMDCDYKVRLSHLPFHTSADTFRMLQGWLLQRVLDIAMPIAQTTFVECVRNLPKKMKEEGKF